MRRADLSASAELLVLLSYQENIIVHIQWCDFIRSSHNGRRFRLVLSVLAILSSLSVVQQQSSMSNCEVGCWQRRLVVAVCIGLGIEFITILLWSDVVWTRSRSAAACSVFCRGRRMTRPLFRRCSSLTLSYNGWLSLWWTAAISHPSNNLLTVNTLLGLWRFCHSVRRISAEELAAALLSLQCLVACIFYWANVFHILQFLVLHFSVLHFRRSHCVECYELPNYTVSQ